MSDTVREIVFWDCHDDPEYLSHEDIDEAIHDFLESTTEDNPDKLEVYGWARKIVPTSDFGSPLELTLHELFDKGIGLFDPEKCDTIDDYITPAMREAEKIFIEAISLELKPWACEIVDTQTIDVAAWIAEHKPEWAEEEGK